MLVVRFNLLSNWFFSFRGGTREPMDFKYNSSLVVFGFVIFVLITELFVDGVSIRLPKLSGSPTWPQQHG